MEDIRCHANTSASTTTRRAASCDAGVAAGNLPSPNHDVNCRREPLSNSDLLASGFTPPPTVSGLQGSTYDLILAKKDAEIVKLKRQLNGYLVLPGIIRTKTNEVKEANQQANELKATLAQVVEILTDEQFDRLAALNVTLPDDIIADRRASCRNRKEAVGAGQTSTPDPQSGGQHPPDPHSGGRRRNSSEGYDQIDSCEQDQVPDCSLCSTHDHRGSGQVSDQLRQEYAALQERYDILSLQIATYEDDFRMERQRSDRLERDLETALIEKEAIRQQMKKYEDEVFYLREDNRKLLSISRQHTNTGDPSAAAAAASSSKPAVADRVRSADNKAQSHNSSHLLSLHDNTTDVWACLTCSFENPGVRSSCEMCGKIRTRRGGLLMIDSMTCEAVR